MIAKPEKDSARIPEIAGKGNQEEGAGSFVVKK
jgi:hypothetical protein